MKSLNESGIWEAIKEGDLEKVALKTREAALESYARDLECEVQRLESENAKLNELLLREMTRWN